MQQWSRKKGMMVSMWDLIPGFCSSYAFQNNVILIYNVGYVVAADVDGVGLCL
jgi:hypothetical protein